MEFYASVGRGITTSREKTVSELVQSFNGLENFKYKYKTGLVLADALSGYTDEIIDRLTEFTAGTYQFFGGGAGNNANFKKTSVFFNEEVLDDAVVILEILSNKPLGLGISHGWHEEEELFRVTESQGLTVKSLNAMPALEVFQDHAQKTGQYLDPNNPIPFFLHNILGIKTENGFKLRVPLAVNDDGSLVCASDIPMGSLVSVMTTRPTDSINAAESAMKTAIVLLKGNKPEAGLFFDCVATRLRLGKDFDSEIEKVTITFPGKKIVGCNTHGQIARMEGQFSGFHNCTAVVCMYLQMFKPINCSCIKNGELVIFCCVFRISKIRTKAFNFEVDPECF